MYLATLETLQKISRGSPSSAVSSSSSFECKNQRTWVLRYRITSNYTDKTGRLNVYQLYITFKTVFILWRHKQTKDVYTEAPLNCLFDQGLHFNDALFCLSVHLYSGLILLSYKINHTGPTAPPPHINLHVPHIYIAIVYFLYLLK